MVSPIFSVFIFVRSLVEEKVVNQVQNDLMLEIKEYVTNSSFCVCLTKYDALVNDYIKGSDYYQPDSDIKIREEKSKDVAKFVDNFSTFKQALNKTTKFNKLSKVFIIDNLHVLSPNNEQQEKPRLQLKEFMKHIDNLMINESNYIN
jgi:hypothetical protein